MEWTRFTGQVRQMRSNSPSSEVRTLNRLKEDSALVRSLRHCFADGCDDFLRFHMLARYCTAYRMPALAEVTFGFQYRPASIVRRMNRSSSTDLAERSAAERFSCPRRPTTCRRLCVHPVDSDQSPAGIRIRRRGTWLRSGSQLRRRLIRVYPVPHPCSIVRHLCGLGGKR